ncbi:GDP-mannose pyrophosphatase NudK [Massilia sp. Bi118]|nr:GDP-mannose pyrophosphatase NudK [Massilia sp. Bi118]
MQDRVKIGQVQLLSDDRGVLKKTTYALRTRAGEWAEQTRETYDRGNGATLLLYNRAWRKVVLTRQFRLPAFVNGHDGFLVETAAGLLDGAHPEERIRAEVMEETGYRVGAVCRLWDAFMSPGSVTERLHFFVAEYEPGDRVGAGGGLVEEGEDLEVLELGIDEAMARIGNSSGSGIVDGKTIMLLQYAQLHLFAPPGMMILIAGPYRSGTEGDPERIARNVAAMEACVLPLYEAGHLPVLGEWLGLPTVRLAGSQHEGDAVYDALFHPHAQRLLARCDAVLRIGGASSGADLMVDTARALGKRVYRSLADIPLA